MSEMTLTLFIAGGTVNSSRAEHNLRQILTRIDGPLPDLAVIDLLKDPQRAVSEGVLVTPTLICRFNNHQEVIIGAMDNTDELLQQIHGWLRE